MGILTDREQMVMELRSNRFLEIDDDVGNHSGETDDSAGN